MPWFPDFANAAELARRQTRAAGLADPVGRYLATLSSGDPNDIEVVWPGEIIVYDPRAGKIRGHRRLRRFVRDNRDWLARRQARIDRVAVTSAADRAVVELLAHLNGDGPRTAWPVAVVAASPRENSVIFRTYCSQWPVDGRRHLRPAILSPGAAAPDLVGRHLAALAAGDIDSAVATFDTDGYVREPVGGPAVHRGGTELRRFHAQWLARGGVELRADLITDDGVRCAVEYTCVRWGGREVPPQAGLGVYERAADGRLQALRLYDDIEPPAGDSARD